MSLARLALIGSGAIANTLSMALEQGREPLRVGAVLVRADSRSTLPGVKVCVRTADLIEWRPTLVAECAGHDAVREVVPDLLAAGINVVIASVGALCDSDTRDKLSRACAVGRSRLLYATGAVGGLDALRAARLGGLDSVTYIGRKPPRAWPRSAEIESLQQTASREAVVLFDGSAGEAARRYPQNANVAAAIALAGVGFDTTRVRLVADPELTRNVHEIHACGAFGELEVRITNEPLAGNPKTSLLAALSLEELIRERLGRA